MALRNIRFARSRTGTPHIQSMAYTTGQTFKIGALVINLGAGVGEIVECGADPAEVTGVAAEPAGSKPGFDAANSPTVVTGRAQEVSVMTANAEDIFAIDGSADAGVTQLTPLVTHLNESYGVAKDANGVWFLDTTEVAAKVFNIVDIDIDNKVFFVKFLQAVIAAAA
jgi:hypothetical protein